MALVTMARPVSLVSQERDFAVCVLLDSLVTAVIQVGTNNMSPPCFISISVESVFLSAFESVSISVFLSMEERHVRPEPQSARTGASNEKKSRQKA